MSADNPIGLRALHSVTWYVADLSRTRRLLVEALGFTPQPSSDLDAPVPDPATEDSVVYVAGSCRIVCSAPKRDSSPAARFLRLHPPGIGRLTLEVDDLGHARRELTRRGATFVSSELGEVTSPDTRPLELATPIDDLSLCLIQRGPAQRASAPASRTLLGPSHIDHVTINTATILPIALWLSHLLGLEKHWETEFHTADGPGGDARGSGLKSSVLWEPSSEIKFALNEPRQPNFFASQIELFRQDHRGSGVQHVAIHVVNIVETVARLRARGVKFAKIPSAYYEQLQARLDRAGVGAIDEPVSTLRELGILVDGSARGQYLLQIFIEDDAAFLGGADRSPFFLELIERKGCAEFGAGNFRALFDSIAAAQATRIAAHHG